MALVVLACGDEEIAAPPPPVTIAITPRVIPTFVSVGSRLNLTVTATNSTETPSWTSRDPTVATASGGVVTAVGDGSTFVVATVGSVQDSVSVSVAIEAAHVLVTPSDTTLTALGATADLSATAEDAGGTEVGGRVFLWESDADEVVAVDPSTGQVTAISAGVAVVTVKETEDRATGTAIVRVSLEPEDFTPGITVLRGAGAVDTVLAPQLQALVVEVRNLAGEVSTGTIVRFEAVTDSATNQPTMFISAIQGSQFGVLALDTVEASGQARTRVTFGRVAGTGSINVVVPDFGFTETVEYTVEPGDAVDLAITPPDTGLFIDSSVTLRGQTIDQFGNPRTEPVVLVSEDPALTITPDGVATSSTIGRYRIRAESGEFESLAFITAVPVGTIAAWNSRTRELVTLNLDGSDFRTLAEARGSSGGVHVVPRWSPDGNEIVFGDDQVGPMHLWVTTLEGNRRPLLPLQAPGSGLIEETWAEYAPDVNRIYFSGRVSGENFKLWRIRPTGTQQRRVKSFNNFTIAWRPSVSPDGSLMAFVTDGAVIRVLDLDADALLGVSQAGQVPRWSPSGNEIAFVRNRGGPLFLMEPDGTNVREISVPGVTYVEESFSWSPDGTWIIARSSSQELHLIDPQTGNPVVLGYTRDLRQPAWRP